MPIQDGWAPTRTARNPQIPNLPLETAAAAGPVDLAGGDGWNHWEDATDQQVFATGSQQSDPAAAADQPTADAWDHWAADAEDALPLDQRVADDPVVVPPALPADPWDHWSAEAEDPAPLDQRVADDPVVVAGPPPADAWDHWGEELPPLVVGVSSQQEDVAAAPESAPAADAWDHWADEGDEDELDVARVADDPVVVAPPLPADPWDHWPDSTDGEIESTAPVAASDLHPADAWDHWAEFVEDITPEDQRVADDPVVVVGQPPADAWAEDDAGDDWDGASAPVGANAAAPTDTPALQDEWEWTSDTELLEFIVLDFPQVEEDPAAFDTPWPAEEVEDLWLGDSAPVVADVVAPVEAPGPADDWDHWADELPVLVVPTGTQQEDVVTVVDPVPPQDEWLEEFEADEWDSAGQPVGADVVVVVDTPALADAWDWVEPDLLEFIVLDFPQVEDDPRIDDAWPWFTDDTTDEWDGGSAPVSAVVADAPTQDAWTWTAEEDADDWWCALDYAVVGADFVAPPASQFFDDPLGFYAGDDAYEVPPDVSDSAPVGPDAVYVPPPTPPVEERRGGAGGKGKRQRVAQAAEPTDTDEAAKRWTTRELEDLDFIMALLASGALDG